MNEAKLLKTLGIGRSNILAPHIDLYLENGELPETWELSIPNSKRDDGFFHPSSHCFASSRSLYFDRGLARGQIQAGIVPEKRRIGASLYKTFTVGHAWHSLLGLVLVEMGLVKPENVERKVQKEVRPNVTGSGTADLVDVVIPGHGTWLVDMKTMNSAEFNRGANPTTFKKWEAQVNCYLDWVGAEQAMILAIQKDSPHNFREYVIEKNQTLLDEIYDRWEYVEECLYEEEPPDCEHGYGEKCDLGDLCQYV